MDLTLLLLTCKSPWWLLLVFNELLFVKPFRPLVIAVWWWWTILFVNDVIWLWCSNWFAGKDDIDGGVSKPGPYLDGDIKIGGLNERPPRSYYVCRTTGFYAYPNTPTATAASRNARPCSISRNASGRIVAVFRGWRSFWTAAEVNRILMDEFLVGLGVHSGKDCHSNSFYNILPIDFYTNWKWFVKFNYQIHLTQRQTLILPKDFLFFFSSKNFHSRKNILPMKSASVTRFCFVFCGWNNLDYFWKCFCFFYYYFEHTDGWNECFISISNL